MIIRRENKNRLPVELIIMLLISFALPLWLTGCSRTEPSNLPPIHLNPNMDDQPKFEPQEASRFYTDSSAMRMPVSGTIARGELRSDSAFFFGMDSRGNFVVQSPLTIDETILERGNERFDIYCSPCHGSAGDGTGAMISRGFVTPPSFGDERIRKLPDGEIYNVITNGLRNMPIYANQIPPVDRWALVAHLRVLQKNMSDSAKIISKESQNIKAQQADR